MKNFPYTELMIVVAIVGILTVTILPMVNTDSRDLEVKVVGYSQTRNEGVGFSNKITYEYWVYEDIKTRKRYISTIKYGNQGEQFLLNASKLKEE